MNSSDFRDTLLELIDTSPEPMDHPSPDQWIAYHRGELPAGEEARLEEHLVRCRDCFDLAEGAAAFAQPDEEPGADQERDTAALWRRLRPQLDPPPPASARQNVREISALAPRRPSWRFRLPYTLAASFFVAMVGMGAWTFHQQRVLEALRAPRPDALIFDFSAGERLPTPTSAERILTASGGPWIFLFHPDDELPVYRLALRDAATGTEVWSCELRPNEDLDLTLQLPEGIRPGRYRLELSDGSGGRAGRTLKKYPLRVTKPGRGG